MQLRLLPHGVTVPNLAKRRSLHTTKEPIRASRLCILRLPVGQRSKVRISILQLPAGKHGSSSSIISAKEHAGMDARTNGATIDAAPHKRVHNHGRHKYFAPSIWTCIQMLQIAMTSLYRNLLLQQRGINLILHSQRHLCPFQERTRRPSLDRLVMIQAPVL